MTIEREQEAFGLVLERHHGGASHDDIRSAVKRFIETAGIAEEREMSTEIPPGVGNPGRIDLYVHNTCIEFKKNMLRHGDPNPEDVKQLDDYLMLLLKAGSGVRNGVLTDGVHYLLRSVVRDSVSPQPAAGMRTFNRAEEASRLREYLHGIISAPAENVAPTAENLRRFFGRGSETFGACQMLLQEAYEDNRDDPSVSVKRRLWQDLLQVALGKDAATDSEDSDWLFLRHTYITSLVAVIMQQPMLGNVARRASESPDDLLKGHILAKNSNLYGVIDADLFTWPTEVGQNQYLQIIARVVEWFTWEQKATEVAPTIYQNVITQEERKKLGEYYTPRWLAQEITETVVDDPLNQRVLDPSCGSGTFIEAAVEHILAHSSGLSAAETLQKLQNNIVGIDIHPVAVQLAKATWVMAAKDIIFAARKEEASASPVSVPIYLGDSLQLRYNTGTIFATKSIELTTDEILPNQPEPVVFSIPKELARQQVIMDRIISEMARSIDKGLPTDRIVNDKYKMSDECRQSLKTIASNMKILHAAGRNHVWAYYIRNMIRPAVIAEEKVDRIIGNPPWLTYSESTDIIRDELRDMSEKRYQIWAGGERAPQQELATLFYTRCTELYAKPQALIGMVMPYSSLRAGHHLKWRGGHYKGKKELKGILVGLDFQVHEPWDLKDVAPAPFNMPASVVFARNTSVGESKPLAPGSVQIWRGNRRADYAGISRTSEILHHDDGKPKSPYAKLSNQGPTMFDRRLFFVEESRDDTVMLPAANTVTVKPRLGKDNYKYEDQLHRLGDVVHNDHLFNVYLGECLAPYVALDPLTAALPAHKATMTMALNHNNCKDGDRCRNRPDKCRLDIAALDVTMQERWAEAVKMFQEAHHRKTTITDLYKNLNFMGKLSNQLEYLQDLIAGNDEIRVAYTTAGNPKAAIIRDNHAVIESKAYQLKCRTEDEAHYILAVMNSNELVASAGSFMSQGLWGNRDFHKHGWKVPIPRYEPTMPLHVRLSELGKTAEQECTAIIGSRASLTGSAGSAQSRPARERIRDEWRPDSATARSIEKAVAELLTDPTQALLAAQQMANT